MYKIMQNSRNYGKSVFYQLDLSDVAADYFRLRLPVPLALPEETDRMLRIWRNICSGAILIGMES